MPFTKKNNIDFKVENNQIKLSPEYLQKNKEKFKKITGSRFASVLGKNTYMSPAKVWATMVGIYTEPFEEMFTKAGNVIEPKIHKIVCDKLNINFKQYNPFTIGWDVFKEDPIFGGIPDGEPVDQNGNFLYPNLPMLEIKTTSIDSFQFKKINNQMVLQKDKNNNAIIKQIGANKEKWFDSNHNIQIPINYQFQLGLYCYLRNIEKGLFAICFLQSDDYAVPSNFNVNERELHLIDYKINLSEFKKFINYGKEWYEQYIINGISPKLSDADIEWLKNEL